MLRIRNGWIPRGYPGWFKANHRAKDITLTFDGKFVQHVALIDANGPQSIPVSNEVQVAVVRITIDTIYPSEFGGDEPSITISEIELIKKENSYKATGRD